MEHERQQLSDNPPVQVRVHLSAQFENGEPRAAAPSSVPPFMPKLDFGKLPVVPVGAPASEDGLCSARVCDRTPRQCAHTPRLTSTFEAGGSLGEPFHEHYSGVYFNEQAPIPALPTLGAQRHLPAAYATLRGLLEPEDAADLCAQLLSARHTPPTSKRAPTAVATFNKSLPTLHRRHPALVDGVLALKHAFGAGVLGLEAAELAAVGFRDVRCVTHSAGAECPWHRDDPRAHFGVVVLLSDPFNDFAGGQMVVHAAHDGLAGAPTDADAMPLHLGQGDALIYCAPRIEHAMQRVTEGSRTVCCFELAVGASSTSTLARAGAGEAMGWRLAPGSPEAIE